VNWILYLSFDTFDTSLFCLWICYVMASSIISGLYVEKNSVLFAKVLSYFWRFLLGFIRASSEMSNWFSEFFSGPLLYAPLLTTFFLLFSTLLSFSSFFSYISFSKTALTELSLSMNSCWTASYVGISPCIHLWARTSGIEGRCAGSSYSIAWTRSLKSWEKKLSPFSLLLQWVLQKMSALLAAKHL